MSIVTNMVCVWFEPKLLYYLFEDLWSPKNLRIGPATMRLIALTIAFAILTACAKETLTVKEGVSTYTIESRTHLSIATLADRAHKAIRSECLLRQGVPLSTVVAVDTQQAAINGDQGMAKTTVSTSVGHSADVLKFAQNVSDLVDIVWPKDKIDIAMKCAKNSSRSPYRLWNHFPT